MVYDTAALLRTIHESVRPVDAAGRIYRFSGTRRPDIDLDKIAPHLLHRRKANTYLFHIGQPLHNVYILLDGHSCVEKYTHCGQLFTDCLRSAPQFFGMLEALTDQRHHTASMKCVTDCVYVKIPAGEYLNAIRTDSNLMMMSLQYLCLFFLEHIQNTDQLMLDDPYRNILLKIFQYCRGRAFPVIVPFKKEELSNALNMNLRTLYRRLNNLYASGLLSSHGGKICVTEEQYRLLEMEFSHQDA